MSARDSLLSMGMPSGIAGRDDIPEGVIESAAVDVPDESRGESNQRDCDYQRHKEFPTHRQPPFLAGPSSGPERGSLSTQNVPDAPIVIELSLGRREEA